MQKERMIQYLLLIGLFVSIPFASPAQPMTGQGGVPKGKKKEPVQYPFDATDYVRGYIAEMPTKTFFVGQPVSVPLVLANHTKYPITLVTNFNFRSMLKVMIRPEGQQSYRYNGPYAVAGYYAPMQYFLYPMDEFRTNVVIWANVEDMNDISGNHLAFPKPGKYTIEVSIRIGIEEGSGGGELPLQDGRFEVEIQPTPKDQEPLVDMLNKDLNLIYLHLHKNPPYWGDKVPADILRQYPKTVFTPWLCYSLASYYALEFERKPTRDNSDKALFYYQVAIQDNKVPFWEEAYGDLLNFVDKLNLGKAGEQLARDFINRISPDKRGRIGNKQVLQKFLVNTEELDPVKCWAFLP